MLTLVTSRLLVRAKKWVSQWCGFGRDEEWHLPGTPGGLLSATTRPHSLESCDVRTEGEEGEEGEAPEESTRGEALPERLGFAYLYLVLPHLVAIFQGDRPLAAGAIKKQEKHTQTVPYLGELELASIDHWSKMMRVLSPKVRCSQILIENAIAPTPTTSPEGVTVRRVKYTVLDTVRSQVHPISG